MGGIEHYIVAYGPIAIFFGAGLEGQTAVIAGGYLAHQQLMNLGVAFGCACAGSWFVDQLLFMAGRGGRTHPWVTGAMRSRGFGRALAFIERYPVRYILAFRFLFGLRMISPVAVGVSGISAGRFFVLNIFGAILWAGAFTAIGYLFGAAAERWLSQFAGLEHLITMAVIGVVLLLLLATVVRAAWMRLRRPSQPPR
jgi:membrane protein DedA with SNARE-associated domain